MTGFVVSAAALALLAIAWLTRPLWRRHAPAPAQREAVAISGLRIQLAQLKALHQAGALGEAAYTAARETLEQKLVAQVTDAPPQAPASRTPAAWRLASSLALFVVVVAVGAYAWLGTPQALDMPAESTAATPAAGHAVTPGQIEAMLDRLTARLKDRPDDADGWAMLGRSYAVLGRHALALPALERAVALRGDDASLLADWADALAVAQGKGLEGEPAALIARALVADPTHLKALSLAGTLAFDRQDYAGALRHWEQMQRQAPDDELTQQIRGGIDSARQRIGTRGMAAAAPAPVASAAAGASVSGTVSLAPALVARTAPDDTVFVFARPAEGARMPLAILRKQVRDLPFAFTLDDSMAMSPAARLSAASRIVVGARVSKSGEATPRPGDLQGLSEPVAPGASRLSLQISEVVRP